MELRFACPHCRAPIKAPSRLAGSQVSCPRCKLAVLVPVPAGELLQVSPVPTSQADSFAFAGSDSSGPATRSRRSSSGGFTILAVILAAVLAVPVVGCCGFLGLGILGGMNLNATCPACGNRFHISEDYRGNNSELLVELPCPRCNQRNVPAVYFDGSRPKPAAEKKGGKR